MRLLGCGKKIETYGLCGRKVLASYFTTLDATTRYRCNDGRWRDATPFTESADRQIDQLVYELYGLTDAEIQIVEAAKA
jgi:hypothetical protein